MRAHQTLSRRSTAVQSHAVRHGESSSWPVCTSVACYCAVKVSVVAELLSCSCGLPSLHAHLSHNSASLPPGQATTSDTGIGRTRLDRCPCDRCALTDRLEAGICRHTLQHHRLTDERLYQGNAVGIRKGLPEWLVVVIVLNPASLAPLQRLSRQLAILWHLSLLHIKICRKVLPH